MRPGLFDSSRVQSTETMLIQIPWRQRQQVGESTLRKTNSAAGELSLLQEVLRCLAQRATVLNRLQTPTNPEQEKRRECRKCRPKPWIGRQRENAVYGVSRSTSVNEYPVRHAFHRTLIPATAPPRHRSEPRRARNSSDRIHLDTSLML